LGSTPTAGTEGCLPPRHRISRVLPPVVPTPSSARPHHARPPPARGRENSRHHRQHPGFSWPRPVAEARGEGRVAGRWQIYGPPPQPFGCTLICNSISCYIFCILVCFLSKSFCKDLFMEIFECWHHL
jgi:hypothetical protein